MGTFDLFVAVFFFLIILFKNKKKTILYDIQGVLERNTRVKLFFITFSNKN